MRGTTKSLFAFKKIQLLCTKFARSNNYGKQDNFYIEIESCLHCAYICAWRGGIPGNLVDS